MNGILTPEDVKLIESYYRQRNNVINIVLVTVSSTLNKFYALL